MRRVSIMANHFGSQASLRVGTREYTLFRLDAVARQYAQAERLPYSLKVLLENLLRTEDGAIVRAEDIEALARWDPKAQPSKEIAFTPARVLLQDFTGVPAVVDLAAMREAVQKMGGDPRRINPLLPAELVIDHSVQVDEFGSGLAFRRNAEIELQRNRERYAFLRWGQKAFASFRVVPPDTGIVHQVNLEYLARVVFVNEESGGRPMAYPDTLVGTDSHTTMINGLGVLGWGVGGIEAEAAMLGQPISMLIPEVVGFRLSGKLAEGATATDLVLTVTQMLRKKGVVGKFVEFFGPGLAELPLADRATIANMAPEYGATCGIFPVDAETLNYLRFSGRPTELVELVEAYTKEQGLFHTAQTPEAAYSDVLELDLAKVEPSLAGPTRPQDRVRLRDAKPAFAEGLRTLLSKSRDKSGASETATATVQLDGERHELHHGAVVIAAITSCTNTSNPSVMLAAGLLAQKAVQKGLHSKPWVKTSLAPGSKVVTDYLNAAGVMPALEQLRFHLVGYGCTTCIAAGTPVLLANGTARPIEQMNPDGGANLFAPTPTGELGLAMQRECMSKGVRDCVSLTLQDGRTLVCTPDHELLTESGQWVRADELVVGRDRVVVGLEAPLDEPGEDERGYLLNAGEWTFTLDTPHGRLRTLAFARLLGHLLGDGSISAAGQGRMTVGQAIDREVVLNDIELLTGKRPVATQYDDRKWTIVLPTKLTEAIVAVPGVRVGRRIDQAPALPEFVRTEECPVAVVREFLGGVFGADGIAPTLQRRRDREEEAVVLPPALSQSARPEHVDKLEEVMYELFHLLARCGVRTKGAGFVTYPPRRSESLCPAARDEGPRQEVRLQLPDGLSFVERVGFRYCVEKALRASAAAVYWRMLEVPHIPEHVKALRSSATAMYWRMLEQLDQRVAPIELFDQLGVRDWFARLLARDEADYSKRYCVEKSATTLPTFSLQVLERRSAGPREVFDLSVNDLHSFVAGTVAVHNCIGNSGPLPPPVSKAIEDGHLVAAAVLSGNRNFEGRIHAEVRANFLASPPLVVAYALAGRMDIDLFAEPIGQGADGKPVYLRDIWPSRVEVQRAMESAISREMFQKQYASVFEGDEQWKSLEVPEGDLFEWDDASTYVKDPPYFVNMKNEPEPVQDIRQARVLAVLGDSITTDHISPAGSIKKDSPAGRYLIEHGVEPKDFNSYGSRRGNHEVMVRGTFANVRLRNQLAPGTEGGVTRHLPDGETMSIYDAAMKYQTEKVPLLILAGKEYGSGSSRDWAAKGTLLLGIRAVLAESFERIHRSNLVGMGILPLQFRSGESVSSLGLSGEEVYDLEGLPGLLEGPLSGNPEITIRARAADGKERAFRAVVRIDTPQEVRYYQHGGILQFVLRQLLTRK
jgi:aconitase A